MDQSQSEWILIVDADEQVTVPLRQEISQLLQSRPAAGIAGYEIPDGTTFTVGGYKEAGSTPTIS